MKSISQAGGNFTYTYDDNGNIVSVVQDGKKTAYTYDVLGQLTQVDDQQENATWVYKYDQGGNILSKKKYAYGVTTGEPTESKTFTYGNAKWKDQLTAVNGVNITYDAIGNPLNDGTWTYTWQNGRQLARMQKTGVNASFVYNENGLRVQKTVNGLVTDYTLHGKNIVHMKQGSNNLHFFYDAQNKPAVVVLNGTAYAYAKKLQGDIIAILDNAGTVVVRYTYDAWGKPICKTGTLADSLGTPNPFRYRCYTYDEETETYYLRSRFYQVDLCRFVFADEILNNDALLGKNQYAYCSNNPVCCEDTDGAWICTLLGGLCGFAIKGIQALCSGKSARETLAAAVGGMCTGAINGIAQDVTLTIPGIPNLVSILASGVANALGDAVEYLINHGNLDDYDWAHTFNQFLTGVISGMAITYSSNFIKKILDESFNQSFAIADELLKEYGIINYSFLETYPTAYGIYLYEILGYNGLTQLMDPAEFLPEREE